MDWTDSGDGFCKKETACLFQPMQTVLCQFREVFAKCSVNALKYILFHINLSQNFLGGINHVDICNQLKANSIHVVFQK